LGYVGLPLAVNLSPHFKVLGFDISNERVKELKLGIDKTLEVEKKVLKKALNKNLKITDKFKDLIKCNVFIATVPTPIDNKNRPDLKPLKSVCKIIAGLLKKGDIVVFESTVFPGATEEICAKELEKNKKKLKSGVDFFLGYSPERVNPGDKEHTIDKINKVVSGQNSDVERALLDIYSKLTSGKIYLAKNIKVAEASKVIENAQRDINIAFINEVTKICSKLGISVYDVLEASKTKWNFLPFSPGLVGGHCIGVDPYYLSHKATQLKINPNVILSGRKTNDQMPKFVAQQIKIKLEKNAKVLFLGFTFKEDVPDLRNSKSIELLKILKSLNIKIDTFDPFVSLSNFNNIDFGKVVNHTYDGVIISVPHSFFIEKINTIKKFLKPKGTIFDIKGVLKKRDLENYWSL
jgi:UDP-N-acetyl-D-galactosamine dehydrogenase